MFEDLTPKEIVALREQVNDPRWFIRNVLGAKLWAQQDDMAQAVATADRVSVRACNASGKSFLAGHLVPWWLARYPGGLGCCENPNCEGGKVIATAASWNQVKNVFWAEIHRACRNSKIKIGLPNQVEIKNADGEAVALGFSPKDPTRMQGFHSPHLLIIVDEAAAPDIPWEAIEGNLAGGQAHLWLLGNPTIPSGYYYETHQGKGGYKIFATNAFDTPNLQGFTIEMIRDLPANLEKSDPIFKYEPFPGLVTRWWVYQKFWQWGENTAPWQSRVLGEFPDQAEDAVFPKAWLTRAKERPLVEGINDRIRAGVDVAGPGSDETVCYQVQGPNILGFKAWHGLDADELVIKELQKVGRENLENVAVDEIGIGQYFARNLERAKLPVSRINVGDVDSDLYKDLGFFNLKASIYWAVRMMFKENLIHGLIDETTISQLAGIRYEEDERGLIRIEPKEKARKRGVASPDRAEALILAVGNTEPAMLKYYRDMAAKKAKDEKPGAPEPTQPSRQQTDMEFYANRLATAKKICSVCEKPIEGSRIEMGELYWCLPCAHTAGMG